MLGQADPSGIPSTAVLAIKGGMLAAALAALVVTLAASDV
jgi:hypothetical protein